MRRAGAALATVGLLTLLFHDAAAQGRRRSGNTGAPGGAASGAPAGSQPQSQAPGSAPLNLRTSQLGSTGLAGAAREKLRAGDCAAALDLFDQALASSTDPTLHRDRGICHEKLGHPYPAIDDYRAYVTEAPDAPDAASIRDRLERLEEDTRGDRDNPRTGPAVNDDVPPSEPIVSDANSGTAVPAKRAHAAGPSAASVGPDEDEDQELRSPLRAGKGFALAPAFAARKWVRDGASFGARETWAECVGIEARYATAPHGAVLLDLGYEHFDSTGLGSEIVAGFTSFLGYELRFPLNPRYDDQLTLAPGIGYEQLAFTPGDSSSSVYSEGGLTGRLRFGYRHMLAGSVAFDVALEAGGAYFFKFDSAVDGHDSAAGMVGARVALLWGL
jgi:hypothetical protein